MRCNVNDELSKSLIGEVENVVKNVAAGISAKVKQKYGMIDLTKVPNHVRYARVQKYLWSIGVEISRRMFISYINNELLPGGHVVKNSNNTYYTREQIINFILIDMFKPLLSLSKVKVMFSEILRPIIAENGLDAAFSAICGIIVSMAGKFEDAVTAAAAEEKLRIVNIQMDSEENGLAEKALDDIRQYTNMVSLCMARGALDFYKYSPFSLLE